MGREISRTPKVWCAEGASAPHYMKMLVLCSKWPHLVWGRLCFSDATTGYQTRRVSETLRVFLGPQIRLLHHLVLQQVLSRVGQDNATGLEHVTPVSDG